MLQRNESEVFMTRLLCLVISIFILGCGSAGGSGPSLSGSPDNQPVAPPAPILHSYEVDYLNMACVITLGAFNITFSTDSNPITLSQVSPQCLTIVTHTFKAYWFIATASNCVGGRMWVAKDGVEITKVINGVTYDDFCASQLLNQTW